MEADNHSLGGEIKRSPLGNGEAGSDYRLELATSALSTDRHALELKFGVEVEEVPSDVDSSPPAA